MTTLDTVKGLNQIDDQELHGITKIMFDSFYKHREYKSAAYVSKKEKLIDSFANFLEQYLELNFPGSKQTKLKLINFIDKLNVQKELLEIESGETSIASIKLAADRLGKKAQSGFESK